MTSSSSFFLRQPLELCQTNEVKIRDMSKKTMIWVTTYSMGNIKVKLCWSFRLGEKRPSTFFTFQFNGSVGASQCFTNRVTCQKPSNLGVNAFLVIISPLLICKKVHIKARVIKIKSHQDATSNIH